MNKRMFQMLVAVLLVVGVLGFVKFQQIQAAIKGGAAYKPQPDAVTTVVARLQDWPATIDAVGSVAPVQGVTLSADLAGVVERIAFESGAAVRDGQVLVGLDTRQERAQLMAAEAQRDLAKTSFDRSRTLLTEKAISQSEFDVVSAQMKQAEARVQEIQASIDRKTIRAPFAGITGIRKVNLGQYVNSGDPVVSLQVIDPLYVNFSVPQQQVSELRVGASVTAIADSGRRATFQGRVTAIEPEATDATRNVQVQAMFRNSNRGLRAGMYVTVRVHAGEGRAAVALPASAINYAPYGNSVFIVEDLKGPDGKSYRGVRQQFVRVGPARGDQVSILEGVTSGQEVVTSGVFKLRTGAPVVVNNAIQPANSANPKPEDS